jgi:hypothetical protein
MRNAVLQTYLCHEVYGGLQFPPDTIRFPVEEGSMVAWEQRLVDETENEQKEALAFNMTRRSFGHHGCTSLQLSITNDDADDATSYFNIPGNFVLMQGFTMYDKSRHSL